MERVIARDVSLDLSRELFDTRVPAGRQFVFDYRRRVELVGLSLRVLVTVHPDHFYTRFFESLLVSGSARIGAKPRSKMRSTPHAGRCSNSTAATCLSPDRQGDAMTRTLRVLVIVALCSTAANIQPTPATAQDGRITVKSTAPFERVAPPRCPTFLRARFSHRIGTPRSRPWPESSTRSSKRSSTEVWPRADGREESTDQHVIRAEVEWTQSDVMASQLGAVGPESLDGGVAGWPAVAGRTPLPRASRRSTSDGTGNVHR